MTLKQALWEIVRDENIIITNQNIDWLLDRASKKATGDAQALKESILERKRVIEENIPSALTNEEKVSEKDKLLLITENKSNNFDVKSNNELFKQALVEGLNRHFDKTIEEAKKIEQIEEMARDICECYNSDGTCYQDDKPCDLKCNYFTDAQYLYEKGYRKQSEDMVSISTVKKWLYSIAINNVGCVLDGDFSDACEEIISRLYGLKQFAEDMKGGEE